VRVSAVEALHSYGGELCVGVSVAQTKRPVRSSGNGGRREQFGSGGQIGPDRRLYSMFAVSPE